MFERLITGPSVEPVTVTEQATYSRIAVPTNPSAEYDELLGYITAAREQVEQMTKYVCMTQRWLLAFDSFPDVETNQLYNYDPIYQLPPFWYLHPAKHSLEMLRRPVAEDGAGSPPDSPVVTYIDPNGAKQTLDPSTYIVFADKITLKPGNCWPNAARIQDAVRIEYTAGVSDATNVSARLKQAIKFLANHFYETRSIVSIEPTSEVFMTLTSLLNGFRLYRVAR